MPASARLAASRRLGETGAARRGHGAHVDQHLDASRLQRRDHRALGRRIHSRSSAASSVASLIPPWTYAARRVLAVERQTPPGAAPLDQLGDDLAADTEPRLRHVSLAPPAGPGEMAFLDFGPPDRAPDLVFLHANGFNARAYRTILEPLAASLRILAPDQRGHGATTLATDRPAHHLARPEGRPAGLPRRDGDRTRGAGRPFDGRHRLAARRGRGAGAGAGAGAA